MNKCTGGTAPSVEAHGSQPGGPNAWVEIATSHVGNDTNVLFDGHEVPIARVTGNEAKEEALDATAGQLTPLQNQHRGTAATAPVVAFHVPAGTAAGTHKVTLRVCGATSEEVPVEVLAGAAPTIESVRLVHGEWPSLLIKGAGLGSATEVVLIASDGAATTLSNVTHIDESSLRVPMDKLGTFDVFVKSPNGLGGGPPTGVVKP